MQLKVVASKYFHKINRNNINGPLYTESSGAADIAYTLSAWAATCGIDESDIFGMKPFHAHKPRCQLRDHT